MQGKTLSNENARKAVTAFQAGREHKLLDSDFGQVGDGERWDERKADCAAAKLRKLKSDLRAQGKKIDASNFDSPACKIVHETLELPPNLAADDGFWRWLSVEKFRDIIEARHSTTRNHAHLRNYGIDYSVTNGRLAILWFRADMLFDAEHKADPYHLATRPMHTDFVESGIIRPRYAWCRSLARAFARFQYRCSSEPERAYLHSTTRDDGVRELYKRLRRLHSTLSFEFMSDDELTEMLESNSEDLERA